MRASWGFRVTPRMHPIDAIASGGKLPGGKSCLLEWNCEGRGNVSQMRMSMHPAQMPDAYEYASS